MFSRFKAVTGTALTLIFLASPAFAAEITAEGAARLKADIQAALEMRKNIQASAGSQYILEGELKVEPTDSYYAVTLPHLKIKDVSGKVYDFGMIAANVIPGDEATEWKAAVAMPTPVRLVGSDGRPAGQVDIGGQKTLGVWDTKLNSFKRLDASFTDIGYSDPAKTTEIKVGAASVKNRLSAESNGHLSGPFSASADDWVITTTTDSSKITIKNLRFDGSIKDYDPEIGVSMQKQMSALGQAGAKLTDGITSPTHMSGLYDMMTDMLTKGSDAFSSRLSVSGLQFDTTNPDSQKPDGLTLNYAGLGFAMEGFRSGLVKTSLMLKYDGLKLQDQTDPETGLVPTSLNLDLAVNQLPLSQILDLGRKALEGGEGAGAMEAMMTGPKLLTDAGTNLTHSFDITSPVYAAKGNGVVNADMKAVTGYTADQSVEIEGLDRMIQLLNAEIAKPDNPDAQDLQGVLQTLTIMQMVGQKDPANPDRRTYKLVVDAEGKSLLNGADMSSLLGGMGGAPALEPAPQSGAQ